MTAMLDAIRARAAADPEGLALDPCGKPPVSWKQLADLVEDRMQELAAAFGNGRPVALECDHSADAAVLSRFPSLIRYFGHRTPDPAAAHHLDEVFRTVLVAHGYEAALVLDHEGVTRLTASADGRAAGAAACGGMAVAALRAGSGPHFTALVDGRRMACFAADVTEDRRHLGVVVLAIGPDTPRPILSPICSATPTMLMRPRNSLDS